MVGPTIARPHLQCSAPLGTEIRVARFWRALFCAFALAELFLSETMKQLVIEPRMVTEGSLGAFIGLSALLAINLLGIGSFVFGWW
jgi:hypothetical protein